jgi:ATP:corrinoid adenosyltransferase
VVVATFVMSVLGSVCRADGQEFVIGIVQFFGLRQISESQAREASLSRKATHSFGQTGVQRP